MFIINGKWTTTKELKAQNMLRQKLIINI